jgi:ubiquinone/menaquinone biosynthesis C-methylase UbiE
MAELDLLETYPKLDRDYDGRAAEKSPEVIRIARRFEKEFFDGERLYGYGGYKYDGRWVKVAERLKEQYDLPDDAAILDIGCAKGFLMHDFQQVMPNCTVAGIDVSQYAIDNAMESVKPYMKVASAESLPYPDKSFDLVVSINSIHNLPEDLLRQSLREIERVCRGSSYVTVDAWRTEQERVNLEKWVLTAKTYMKTTDWMKLFDEEGFKGDYWWFIAN